MLIEKFDYDSVVRPTGENKLPSVTHILSETADKTFLIEWRKRIGDEEADRIVKEATETIGRKLHSYIEWKLGVLPEKPKITPLATMMAESILQNGVYRLDEIWALEKYIYVNDLYGGRLDCVGVHQGEPAIIDFKNSQKPKKLEYLDDNRCQLAAYALAHNERFGTNIKKAINMIATKDGKYQEFVFEGREFDKSVTMWLTRLDTYYKNA